MNTELIFSAGPGPAFDTFCQGRNYTSVHTLTDSNTATLALPILAASSTILAEARNWSMPAGEENKNLATLSNLWTELESAGATRRSLLVNIGGGVVTALGGFAAATFKRGMDYVNSHTPEEIAQVIRPQFVETDLDTITAIVRRYAEQDTWNDTLIFEKASFELLQDILESAGELKKRAPYDKLVNTDFAEAASKNSR